MRLKKSAKTKRVQIRVAVEISGEKEYHFFVTDSIIHTSNMHIFFRQVFISYKPDFFYFCFCSLTRRVYICFGSVTRRQLMRC